MALVHQERALTAQTSYPAKVIVEISDERRAVVEVAWLELVHKLPPQK